MSKVGLKGNVIKYVIRFQMWHNFFNLITCNYFFEKFQSVKIRIQFKALTGCCCNNHGFEIHKYNKNSEHKEDRIKITLALLISILKIYLGALPVVGFISIL